MLDYFLFFNDRTYRYTRMGETWQFISNRPKGINAESRRAIRSAAMKTFRREQRLKRMQELERQETDDESPLQSNKSKLDANQSHLVRGDSAAETGTLSQIEKLVPLQGYSVIDFINNRRRFLPGNSESELGVLGFHSLNQQMASEAAFESGFGWLMPTAQRTPQCYQLLSHCT